MADVIMTVRAAAFTGQGVRKHSVSVDIGEHPRVRVWDSVGQIYTVCHVLSPRTQARIIRQAREAAPKGTGISSDPTPYTSDTALRSGPWAHRSRG